MADAHPSMPRIRRSLLRHGVPTLGWLVAATCGALVTLGLLTALAWRVRSAEAAVLPPLRDVVAVCQDGFVASGERSVPVETVVGHRPRSGARLIPIAGATLSALEGGSEFDWRGRERPAATSDGEGRLAFAWSQRFRDRYACGALVDSWQQASQLFVLRAPGCAEETLVVGPGWQREEIALRCPGRDGADAGIRL